MKKLLAITLAVLFWAQPAFAAFTHIGSLGTNNATTSGNTLVITTSATLEAGNLGVLGIAADNVGTTDGDFSEVSSITDTAGNTYTKICEFTNGQGGAAAGATVSMWLTVATAQLTSGQTVTINFANTIDSRVARFREFTIAANKVVTLAGSCQTQADDANDLTTMSISGLTSKEYLFYRMAAQETDSNTEITTTASYTANGTARAAGADAAHSERIVGEFRILTATGSTSDPTASVVDSASVYVALQEADPPATRRPAPPIIFP